MKNKYLLTYAVVGVLLTISLVFMFSATKKLEAPSGAFTFVDIAPKGFIYDEPDLITAESAQLAINNSIIEIDKMRELGFVTIFANDALKEAKNAYANADYAKVFELTQLITYIKKEKVNFIDRVKLMEVKKQVLEDKGTTGLTDANKLMQQAFTSFSLEQFDEANELLDAANAELTDAGKEYTRAKTIALLGKNFFVKYWWQNLLVLAIILAAAPLVYKRVNAKILKTRISRLKLEEKKLKGLIKHLQKECFIDKTITTKAYKMRAAKYEDRITDIKRSVPVLEDRLRRNKSKSKNKKKGDSIPDLSTGGKK